MHLKNSALVELNSSFLQKSSEKKSFILLKSRNWKLDEILDMFHITVDIPEKVWLTTNTRCNDAKLYLGGEWEHR